MDALGLDTERLPRDSTARLAYVTPSRQFPPGGTLPITRRQALLAACRQAKRLADRHAPLLEQRALASLIDSGACERHVRRIRRENKRRRAALLEAVTRHRPQDTRVEGAAAGLHVERWLPSLHARDEPRLVDGARRRGVGVHPGSGLYATPALRRRPRPAGLVVGYASLGVEEIVVGIRALAQALAELQ